MRANIWLGIALVLVSLPACGAAEHAKVSSDSAAAAADLTASQSYEIVSVGTGLALDVIGVSTAAGAGLQEYPFWNGANQQWTLTQGSSGNTWGLISVNSGLALDIPNGSTTQGTLVQQWYWWNGPMQNWSLNQQSDGSYEIVSLATGMCLDIINGSPDWGTRVQEWPCWGGSMQRWNLNPASGAPWCSAPGAACPASSSGGGYGTPQPSAVDFQASGNDGFDINDYGSQLQTNKQALESAISQAGATINERALIVAMAMQETTTMDISQRDSSKDGTPSANVSILNINASMLMAMGYQGNDNGASLNDPSKLPEVVSLLINGGFRTWGIAPTLNYQRGGQTAFQDGVSYGAADYRAAIATIFDQIAADTTLLNDSRRVEIDLDHV